jgi:hypothetical protein
VLWGLVGEEGMGRRCRLSVDFVFGCKAVVVFLFVVRISFIIILLSSCLTYSMRAEQPPTYPTAIWH